jgi:hypothetical protein
MSIIDSFPIITINGAEEAAVDAAVEAFARYDAAVQWAAGIEYAAAYAAEAAANAAAERAATDADDDLSTMTRRELADAHFFCLLDRADEEAARETEHRRQMARRPKKILCHACSYHEYETICAITVTEEAHGRRVYPNDECPHQCTSCKCCYWCEINQNRYEHYVEEERDNSDYWAFGNDDLGEYGCPKVEPVRNRKVKSKPKTVATSAPVKVKTKYPVKPKSYSHIRTHA